MSFETPEVIGNYTARLHLVSFDAANEYPRYRSLLVGNLARPQFDTVENHEFEEAIKDKDGEIVETLQYNSIYAVPNLAAIDFLGVHGAMFEQVAKKDEDRHLKLEAEKRRWLSSNDTQLYDLALELHKHEIAGKIAGSWTDVSLRTTHFNTGIVGADGQSQYINAAKLAMRIGYEDKPPYSYPEMTPEIGRYIGRRMLAFTIGQGNKHKTHAFGAIIGLCAKLGHLPRIQVEELSLPINPDVIRSMETAMYGGLIPAHSAYIARNYGQDGKLLPSNTLEQPDTDRLREHMVETERLSHRLLPPKYKG